MTPPFSAPTRTTARTASTARCERAGFCSHARTLARSRDLTHDCFCSHARTLARSHDLTSVYLSHQVGWQRGGPAGAERSFDKDMAQYQAQLKACEAAGTELTAKPPRRKAALHSCGCNQICCIPSGGGGGGAKCSRCALEHCWKPNPFTNKLEPTCPICTCEVRLRRPTYGFFDPNMHTNMFDRRHHAMAYPLPYHPPPPSSFSSATSATRAGKRRKRSPRS